MVTRDAKSLESLRTFTFKSRDGSRPKIIKRWSEAESFTYKSKS